MTKLDPHMQQLAARSATAWRTEAGIDGTLTVTVTASDIAMGEAGAMYKCPIALAMSRLGCQYPAVDTDRLEWKQNGVKWCAAAPEEVTRFVERFDDHYLVKPFTFMVEAGVDDGEVGGIEDMS